MNAHDVLRVARRRAGLTQLQLATRMGRPRSTIAGWETPAGQPSFADVTAALWACGFELGHELFTRDSSLTSDASRRLQLEPLERARRLHLSHELAAVLLDVARNRVECVVVGEVAGALQGWPLSLSGRVLEFVVAEHDHERLLASLASAGAAATTMPDHGPRWRAETTERFLLPKAGAIAVMHRPAGLPDYRQLAAGADRLVLDDADQRVASVHDLIVMAEASRDVGDRRFLTALYAVLEARRWPPPRRLEYNSPEAQAALAGSGLCTPPLRSSE